MLVDDEIPLRNLTGLAVDPRCPLQKLLSNICDEFVRAITALGILVGARARF